MKRLMKYLSGTLSIIALAFAVNAIHPITAGAEVDGSRDCDSFAIIRCGTMSPEELRTEYDSYNVSGQNGSTVRQPDIQRVFSALGVSRSELNGTFKSGIVHQNGNVTVDGKIVARNATMAARGLGGSPIANSTASVVSVSKMGSDQTAMVKFDQNGRFVMAVMKPCGNPVKATPTQPEPQPSAKCEGIARNKISRNVYSFIGAASVKDGAKVKAYTFTARDKSGKVVEQKTVRTSDLRADSGRMTFEKPGEYTIRLTVDTTVGDKTDAGCVTSINVAPEPKPNVAIVKKVNNKEQVTVGVNQEFMYQIAVTNTGQTVLRDAIVTDKQPTGVTFISASAGTIANGQWKHTINLAIGETKNFTIKAKIPTYLAGKIKNTVCVDAPSVPGNPDDCDDAYVNTPSPQAVCVQASATYVSGSRTDFKLNGRSSVTNGATVNSYIFTIKDASGAVVKTETLTSTELRVTTNTLSLTNPGTYTVNLVVKTSVGDRTSAACNTKVVIAPPNMVPVCDPATGEVITVPEDQAGNYVPVNDPACQPPEPVLIEVCELSTKNIITINQADFNAALHSKDPAACDEPEEGTVQVCDPETGNIVTVPQSMADDYEAANSDNCKDDQPVTPAVLPDTGVGSVLGLFASISAGGAIAHRLIWTRRFGA